MQILPVRPASFSEPMANNKLNKRIKQMKVVIVTHVYTTGPAQEFERYFKGRFRQMLFIGHPFSYCRDIRSFCKKYQNGKLVKAKKAPSWKLPEILIYAKDLAYSFFWVLFSKGTYDIYVGADCLNALAGLLLRAVGKAKKVIFYTIDYVPARFENKILNNIYHFIEKICCYHSNFIWVLSENMTDARDKEGILKSKSAPQVIVPNGSNYDEIKRLPISRINRHDIAFLGHLRQNQGVDVAISAFPKILKEVPSARLIVIGSGPVENKLKKLAENLGLKNKIIFKGFIQNHRKVEKILAKCAIAVAPYAPVRENFTYFTDPGKIKTYFAAGLPVIITNVPSIAKTIHEKRAGIMVNYSECEFASAVIKLLKDDLFYEECRRNAISLGYDSDWGRIFSKALAETIY